MDSITAKQWREMSTPDIIASLDTAIEVLRKRNIDEEWMGLHESSTRKPTVLTVG